jgi:hypothetical protein
MSATRALNVAEIVAALKNSGYENEEGAIRAVPFRNATSTLDGLTVAKYQICVYDENEGELALGL